MSRGVPSRRGLPFTIGPAARASASAPRISSLSPSRVGVSQCAIPRLLARSGRNKSPGTGMRGLRRGERLRRHRHGIGDDLGNGQFIVGQAVDEGGIRTVFQQAPDQIGE